MNTGENNSNSSVQEGHEHDMSSTEHVVQPITPVSPDSMSLSPNSVIQDTLEQGTEPSTIIPNPPIVHNLPIALRKPVRRPVTPPRLKDYVGHKHDIAKFISYDNCNPLFKSFIASLDSISIPKDWR